MTCIIMAMQMTTSSEGAQARIGVRPFESATSTDAPRLSRASVTDTRPEKDIISFSLT